MCEHHAALGVAIERDLPSLSPLVPSPASGVPSLVQARELVVPASDARAALLGILATARAAESRLSGDAKKGWQDQVVRGLATAIDYPLPNNALDGTHKAQTIVALREALKKIDPDIELPGFILSTQAPKKKLKGLKSRR